MLGPAAWRNRHELPDWCRWLVLGGASYLLSQALLNRFSGGDHFYGYRTSLELVVALAPALALSAHRMGARARRWFTPVALLQLAVIAPGAVRDDLHVPVADVWSRHAFLEALTGRPQDVVPVVAGALVAGVLAASALRHPPVVAWLHADAAAPAPPVPALQRERTP